MRRYLQGTLDYACGLYAVVNALACTHGLDLARGRYIFQETLLALSGRPGLWMPFARNDTDHYWLVNYLLAAWCGSAPWRYRREQPFSSCLLGRDPEAALENAGLYLPEKEPPRGPASAKAAAKEAAAVWESLGLWFGDSGESTAELLSGRKKRVALLRFHRFLPGLEAPIVSHWTTVSHRMHETLVLHDSSSEKQALFSLERTQLMPVEQERAMVRIVPESIVLLEAWP